MDTIAKDQSLEYYQQKRRYFTGNAHALEECEDYCGSNRHETKRIQDRIDEYNDLSNICDRYIRNYPMTDGTDGEDSAVSVRASKGSLNQLAVMRTTLRTILDDFNLGSELVTMDVAIDLIGKKLRDQADLLEKYQAMFGEL